MLGMDKLKNKVLRDRVPFAGFKREEFVVSPELLLPGDLLADQFCCVGGGDDRCIVPVCKFRDGSDMVEVPVRADNCLDGSFDCI